LGLPDAWLAAGAVRNAVWDAAHGFVQPTALTDADVVWFDAAHTCQEEDRRVEMTLSARLPGVLWSVKNQARMHVRNGHAPYADCLDAMRAWPETATAVAARLLPDGTIELQAPYGYADLLDLVLRPTPRCPPAIFAQRVAEKGWLHHWPRLTLLVTTKD
jgi:hypothetical protein